MDSISKLPVMQGTSSNLQDKSSEQNPVSPEKLRVARREALVALPLIGAAAVSNPARALILTGPERDSLKQSQTAIDRLQSRVSTFKLPNGMKWVVLERHNAPIITCHTYADVGASDESPGLTGIAHLLEHLAFKGTKLVGSRDFTRESAALEELDGIFYALREAKSGGNSELARKLRKELKEAQQRASRLSAASEYGSLIERQGGVGLNAQTSQDSTEYYVSLPANKLELWMALESGRFRAPVFRDLYSEKEVVKEERRLRVENSPYGRFTEAFTEVAFPGRAYGRPVIGYPEDFESIGRREVEDFFTRNYTPSKLTCAVVGDVDPVEVERQATRYFGGWKTPGSPSESGTSKLWRAGDGWEESDALSQKSSEKKPFTLISSSQPLYMEGYYRPASWSSDEPVISVISELVAGSRVSRFYKRLIAPGRVLAAECVSSFPGDKYPCMVLLYAAPSPGTGGVSKVPGLLRSQLEELGSKPVDELELVSIKKSTRASLLEALGSNSAMARLLSSYEATTGSWTRILEETSEIESVSSEDVNRVAAKLFRPSNRITGSTRSA